jgi:hypothetical protein
MHIHSLPHVEAAAPRQSDSALENDQNPVDRRSAVWEHELSFSREIPGFKKAALPGGLFVF